MTKIVVGFEIGTGKEVAVPLNHMVITGKTGTGKSQLMKGMIERLKTKTLVLDVKSKRDYPNFPDIELYIDQGTDALALKNMIESTTGMGIKQELSELSRLCTQTSNLDELVKLAKKRQDKPKLRDYYKDRLEILILLLEPVLEEHHKYKWSDSIKLPNDVNVMDLSTMSDALQQIVVASVLNYINEIIEDLTICIDEAHRFIPQKASSAARKDFVRIMREGRARNDFVWIVDQTITGIDKDALKQIDYWILGRQTELNEAKRTLNQIPHAKSLGLKVSDIQTLKLGEFIVMTPRWVKKVYAQPTWVPRESAIKVAMGELEPEEAARRFEHKGDDDMVWKDQYSKLSKDYEKLKADYEKTVAEKDIANKKNQELESKLTKMTGEILKIQEKMKKMKPTKEKPSKPPKEEKKPPQMSVSPFPIEPTAKTPHELEPTTQKEVIEVPEEILVENQQPKITVIVRQPPLTLTDEEVLGKIAILYAENYFPKDKWFSRKDIVKGFNVHAWGIPRGTHLSDAMNQLTQWGYFIRQLRGKRPDYKLKLYPEEAEDMGLIKKKVTHK